jgi:hypothetical protein
MANRGFISIQLAAALAAAAVILGLSVALKVQSARLDAKSAELEACAKRYEETLILVRRQNEAVKTLEKEAAERAKRAAAALAKARAAQGSLEAEIARLKGLKPADCAEAVAGIRSGLKP